MDCLGRRKIFLDFRPQNHHASSNSKCNFLISWLGGRDVRASRPLDRQVKVAINERTSRYSLIANVPFKTAVVVSNAMIAMLKPFSMCVHTLTTDNGREFAQHERIAATLDADFYLPIRIHLGSAAPTRT